MVTKGLDFEHVSLVGILNADNMLNLPDFRAHERAYQLMAQVSGRAGRKNKRGLVVLQTSQPEHTVIGQVIRNDYAAMYKLQTEERKQFKYPPYFRMIQNRRGYAPYIECKGCAYVPKCKNCDVSLTVHKVFNTLTCHY